MGRVWVLVLSSVLGCAASSPRTVPSAGGGTAACPPAPPEIARLLGEGRIQRASQALARVPERCRHALGDTWGEAAVALAELGEFAKARAEADRIDADPRATPGARRGATRAREHVARANDAPRDQKAMLDAYDRALDAEHEGQAEIGIRGYLEAWSRSRPNPRALIRAGRVHGRAGRASLAQRFYDRGIAELARTTGKAPVAVGFSVDSNFPSASVAWVPGERAIAVYQSQQLRILDSNTLDLLATHDTSSLTTTFSPNGRFLATWSISGEKSVHVFHARSGHRITKLELPSVARRAVFDPKSARIAIIDDAGVVHVFAVSSGARHARFDAAQGSPTQLDLQFLDDSRLYAAFHSGQRQFVWNVDNEKELWTRDAREPWAAAQRSGENLVYLSVTKAKAKGKAQSRAELVIQNLTTGKLVRSVPVPSDAQELALASADVAVVTLSGAKAVAHRLDTGQKVAHIELANWERVHVSNGPAGSVVLKSADPQQKARSWTPATNRDVELPFREALYDPVFGPALARGESGREVFLEDPDTLVVREPSGAERKSLRARSSELGGIALSPTGEGIVVGDGRGIRSLSLRSARLGWLGERGLPNADLDFSADGKTLLAAGPRLVVLDGKSGAVRDQLALPDMLDAHISADGTEVVAVEPTRGVVWNLREKSHRFQERDIGPGESGGATAMCCQNWVIGPDASPFQIAGNVVDRGPHVQSGDGNRIAIAFQLEDLEGSHPEGISPVHAVELFDAKTHARIARVHTRYETFVAELAIDWSGSAFVTVSGVGGGANLYRVETRQAFYLGELRNVSFRRDGRMLGGVAPEGASLHRTSDGRRLGSFLLSRTDADSAAFIAHDGRVEWIGKPGGVALGCLAGTEEVPFEVCADRLLQPGLIRETFATYPP
jgi:WD40 repeat protein